MKDLPPIGPNEALFLDFDGTLVDLAPRPEDVRVSDDLIAALSRLQDRLKGALAVVSGRPISQIDGFLAPLHLPAAGLHGLEHRHTVDADIERTKPGPEIRALKGVVRNSGLLEKGVYLEDKGATLALHYRSVPAMEEAVVRLMNEALEALPSLHIIRGKMVVEAKPFASDKGSAVRSFLEHAPFKGRKPIFIGDDVTDEDGIAAAQDAGGIGIKVGDGETCAHFRLRDVAAVHDWLAGNITVTET
jgi:trehalose 6-phosphate phosphatase